MTNQLTDQKVHISDTNNDYVQVYEERDQLIERCKELEAMLKTKDRRLEKKEDKIYDLKRSHMLLRRRVHEVEDKLHDIQYHYKSIVSEYNLLQDDVFEENMKVLRGNTMAELRTHVQEKRSS